MQYYNSLESLNLNFHQLSRAEIQKLMEHPNVLFQLAVARSEQAAYLCPDLFLKEDEDTYGLSGLMVSNWFVLNQAANQNKIARQSVSWDDLIYADRFNLPNKVHNPDDELIPTAQNVSDRQQIRELAKHPNVYVVEGIAKNTVAAEVCPDLFLKKKLWRKEDSFLISTWHILRSAALGNTGVNAKDLNWAYKYDMRDKKHYVRDTEAYAGLAANPKASTATLNGLIKNEKDTAVVNLAEMAKQLRDHGADEPLKTERFVYIHGGAVGSYGDAEQGAFFAMWLLCGAPYNRQLIQFLKENCQGPISINDIAATTVFNENVEFEKYQKITNKNLKMFRPEMVM